jgi:hypothetical protein
MLLTRMNVVSPFGTAQACLNRDWLEHRFSLFERYTLPSVMAQVGAAPFTWVLFSHPETPADFKARLTEYARRLPFIRIEPCAEFDGVSARQAVANLLHPETNQVITSRVDNDDAIGRTFIATVRAEAARAPLQQGGCFINFDLGYQLQSGKVYHTEHRSNPFCSVVEQREGFKGVYAVQHNDLASLYPVVNVADGRRWLAVIHDRNAVNRVDGVRCRSAELVTEFDWLPPGEVVPYGWIGVHTQRVSALARRAVSKLQRTIPLRTPSGARDKNQAD